MTVLESTIVEKNDILLNLHLEITDLIQQMFSFFWLLLMRWTFNPKVVGSTPDTVITPSRNLGYIFIAVCLIVCVCLYVCPSTSKQDSSRTDAPVWTRFSLNGCIPHWVGPYWNWWLWFTSLLWTSTFLCPIKMKFRESLRYALGRFVFEFCKSRMDDDVIVTSFKLFIFFF